MYTAGLTVLLGFLLGAAEGSPVLPQDARLEPIRPRLEAIVARATEAGLPADVVVSKVREGLAKGVDPRRIEAAVSRLYDHLEAAHKFVAQRRPGAAPAPVLVRALAEAQLAGLDLAATDALVRGARSPGEGARAVEVLADLSLRGYPSVRASGIVKEVLVRDPGAIARLPASLEVVRVDAALTHVESVDALSRNLAGAESLQAATARTLDDERRRGPGGNRPGKDDKAGKSGIVPPGLLKKQGAAPGRGRRP
jgi:hypothetical protein